MLDSPVFRLELLCSFRLSVLQGCTKSSKLLSVAVRFLLGLKKLDLVWKEIIEFRGHTSVLALQI